jgi:hypothetical protein
MQEVEGEGQSTEEWIKSNTPRIVALFYTQLAGFADHIAEQATLMLEGKAELNARHLSVLTETITTNPIWQDCEMMLELLTKMQSGDLTPTEQQALVAKEIASMSAWVEGAFSKRFAMEFRELDKIRVEMVERLQADIGKPQLYVPGQN